MSESNKHTLERGYVAATILNVKDKYFGEHFVTIKELSHIEGLLMDQFDKKI